MRWWERTEAVGKTEGNAAQPPAQWNSQSHRSSFAYTYTFYSSLVPKFSPKYPISCACKLLAFNPSVGKSRPQRGRNHTNGVCCWPEKRSWQSNKIPYISFWKRFKISRPVIPRRDTHNYHARLSGRRRFLQTQEFHSRLRFSCGAIHHQVLSLSFPLSVCICLHICKFY